MRISDVLGLFDGRIDFVRINETPIDVRRYAQVETERWVDQPKARWIGIANVADSQDVLADSFTQVFNSIGEYESVPEAVVFILVGELERLPIALALEQSELAGFQFVAAFPLRYEITSAGLIAVSTEEPLSVNRWLRLLPPSASPARLTRLSQSQKVLEDAVRRADVSRERAIAALTGTIEKNSSRERIAAVEAEARRRERHSEAQHKTTEERLTNSVRRAQLEATAAKEAYRAARASSAYRLGDLIGRSIRNPISAIGRFPAGLSRILADREKAEEQAKRARDAALAVQQQVATSQPQQDEYTVASLPPSTRIRPAHPRAHGPPHPAVSYVSHPFYGGDRRSNWQVDLLPGGCVERLEELLPRVLVVDTSAFRASSPWAGAMTGHDPKKARLLVDLLHVARQYGIPFVLRWDDEPSSMPVLSRIAQSADWIVSASSQHTYSLEDVIPHGVAIERWPLNARVPAPNTIVRFESETVDGSANRDSAWSKGRSTPDGETSWVIHDVPASVLHRPTAMRETLRWSGLALFANHSSLSLPILEAVASGTPVIADRSFGVKGVHAVAATELSEQTLTELRSEATQDVWDIVWTLRQDFSTLAEARRLGRVLSIPELASQGVISLLVDCRIGSVPEWSELVTELRHICYEVVVVAHAEASGEAASIALTAQTVGLDATVASNWNQAMEIIRSESPRGGFLWMADRPGSPGVALEQLKRLAGRVALSDSKEGGEVLITTSELLDLDNATASWILEERSKALQTRRTQ